jgi:branched-chain amino acid transport system ATP-binding protein
MPLLEVDNLKVSYGRVRALRGFSLQLEQGSAVAVLGSNGAGKTTLLKTISGLPQAASHSLEMEVEQGEIRFQGRRIDKESPDAVVRLGIAHVPEGREVFPDLTVEENLRLGAYARGRLTAAEMQQVYERFPVLAERRRNRAQTLSGGEQQMLAIGRALLAKPRLLLLDEPSLGLAPVFVDRIFEILHTIRRSEGISVLLVEQNANLALDFADFGYVLETGRGMLAGTSDDLRSNETVREFYLGVGEGSERRSYAHAKTYRGKKRWR